MSKFEIDYDELSEKINIHKINQFMYDIAINQYYDQITNLRVYNYAEKPTLCNIPQKYINIDSVKYILYELEIYYKVPIEYVYIEFNNELDAYENDVIKILEYFAAIRYDTVINYSKFVTEEIITFIRQSSYHRDIIEDYEIIEYSEGYDMNQYLLWLFDKQDEFVGIYTMFNQFSNMIIGPTDEDKELIEKYNNLYMHCKLWMEHLMYYENMYMILKHKMNLINFLIVDIIEDAIQ